MQTRKPAVSAASMHREERAGAWIYEYQSQPHGEPGQQLAAVRATCRKPHVAYLAVHVTPDDDAWSEDALSIADFVAKVKSALTTAIDGAL